MKRFPIAIIDSLFNGFLAFIISFLIINFYVTKPYSIVISLSISIFISFLAFDRICKQRKDYFIKNQTLRNIENMVCAFCFMSKSNIIKLFEKALTQKGYSLTTKSQCIIVQDKNVVIFPMFNFDGITKTDVVRVYNLITKTQTAYIFGNEITNEVASFIERFDEKIVFIGKEKVYSLLNSTNCLPKEKLPVSVRKTKLKTMFSSLLNKVNYKKFLLFGLLFILMSNFVPLKMYYIVVGTIFLTFALIVKLFGKKQAKQKQV